jgi:hypothetical protein
MPDLPVFVSPFKEETVRSLTMIVTLLSQSVVDVIDLKKMIMVQSHHGKKR